MSELKPCAHCKGTKIRAVTKRAKAGHYGDGLSAYHVTAYATCGQCYARGPVVSNERIPSTRTANYKSEVDTLIDKAIAAWNRRAAPCEIAEYTETCEECGFCAQGDNEPLTLEALRGMVGEWVWVEVEYRQGNLPVGGYALVATPCVFAFLEQRLRPEDYGKTWLAYRRKPEAEGGEG